MAAGILSTNVIVTSQGEVTFAYSSIPFSFYGCRDPEFERDRDVRRSGDLCIPFFHIIIIFIPEEILTTTTPEGQQPSSALLNMRPLHTFLAHSHSMAAGILSTNVIVTSRGEVTFATHSNTFSFYGCRDPEYECDRNVTR